MTVDPELSDWAGPALAAAPPLPEAVAEKEDGPRRKRAGWAAGWGVGSGSGDAEPVTASQV